MKNDIQQKIEEAQVTSCMYQEQHQRQEALFSFGFGFLLFSFFCEGGRIHVVFEMKRKRRSLGGSGFGYKAILSVSTLPHSPYTDL